MVDLRSMVGDLGVVYINGCGMFHGFLQRKDYWFYQESFQHERSVVYPDAALTMGHAYIAVIK